MSRYFKAFITSMTFALASFAFMTPAFAHVVVKPTEVKTAAYQTFTVSVPSEKALTTVGLRLVVPENLKSVTPNVKPGWTITTKKNSDNKVIEINWTKGSIPSERRDEFVFSAQAPSDAVTLTWKAYQTYSDGSVVSWDQETNSDQEDVSKTGPASKTTVLADQVIGDTGEGRNLSSSMTFALAAFALSIVALVNSQRRRK
jgi:uncharacterized protein YcnI